jgi:hypothetical protein
MQKADFLTAFGIPGLGVVLTIMKLLHRPGK